MELIPKPRATMSLKDFETLLNERYKYKEENEKLKRMLKEALSIFRYQWCCGLDKFEDDEACKKCNDMFTKREKLIREIKED